MTSQSALLPKGNGRCDEWPHALNELEIMSPQTVFRCCRCGPLSWRSSTRLHETSRDGVDINLLQYPTRCSLRTRPSKSCEQIRCQFSLMRHGFFLIDCDATEDAMHKRTRSRTSERGKTKNGITDLLCWLEVADVEVEEQIYTFI